MTNYKVVFGEVLEGKSIVRKIENLQTQADKPTRDATIVGEQAVTLCVSKELSSNGSRLWTAHG